MDKEILCSRALSNDLVSASPHLIKDFDHTTSTFSGQRGPDARATRLQSPSSRRPAMWLVSWFVLSTIALHTLTKGRTRFGIRSS